MHFVKFFIKFLFHFRFFLDIFYFIIIGSENIVHDRADQDKRNLFRFTQNWNNGMLEYWNDGLKKQCASRMPYPVFQYSTIPSFHMAYKVDDHKKH